MNGVHDMGGMHGMGPVQAENDEPVFHERWEARVYVLTRAIGAWRKWNIDTGRFYIERIAPADYLRMSYYEKWFVRLVELLVKTGMVSREEVESGVPAPGSPKLTPPLRAEQRARSGAQPEYRSPATSPRFGRDSKPGSACARATSTRPATRVCRVTRAARRAGSSATTVSTISRTPTPMAAVRNASTSTPCVSPRASFGASRLRRATSVHLDLWDDYLEHA